MASGKERVRRWRERSRVEGKQSFTVMLSQEAKNILHEEKQASGASYSTIIEQALLNNRKTAEIPVRNDHHTPHRAKILIDEDGMLWGDIEGEAGYEKKIAIENETLLNKGFMPRLLKRSNSRLYKIKKL